MYATYLRLDIMVWDSNRTVIRAARRKLASSAQRDPARRDARKRFLSRDAPPPLRSATPSHALPPLTPPASHFSNPCPASRRALSSQEPDMADYFIHFSCLLDVGTPDNAARALDLYNRLSEEGASEEPPSDGFLLSILSLIHI